jgi:nucleoside-diphosphate-sugar epimerase
VLDDTVSKLGNATVVHGDLEKDLDKLKSLAAEHDIIVNMANSRDVVISGAILDGIRNRKDKSKKGILLHLSGTGNFVDGAEDGIRSTAAGIFVDSNPEHVRKINANMPPNGESDELFLKAALAGEAIVYFVCPAGIYGSSKNHIARDAGEQGAKYANTPGVWAGWSMENVENLGFSPYVGPGNNIFWTVHVDDVVSLMILVYKRIIEKGQNYAPTDVLDNWYIAAGEQHEPKRVAEAFGELMARRGKIAKGDVRQVTFDEAGITARFVQSLFLDIAKLTIAYRYLAGNMLIKAENGEKKLGWKPQAPSLYDVLKTL